MHVFAIDLRSLALLRVGLALLLLGDALLHGADFAVFYGERGVLPVAQLPLVGGGGAFSLHTYASGSPPLLWLLFGVQLGAALALLVGWQTRVASGLCWLLLASAQLRNPFLAYSGADRLLRLLLFWAMFLPLGARFSLDARRAGREPAGEVLSVASAALLLQLGIVYWSNGLNKLVAAEWIEGNALERALGVTFFGGRFGPWLAQQGWLMKPGAWGTVAFEILAPCFAFVPWRTDWLRLATVAVLIGFHIVLMGAFDIGWFPLVCSVAWLAFLPGVFWEALPGGRALRGRLPQPVALEIMSGALLAWLIVYVAAGHLGIALPGLVRAPGAALRLTQHWGQFEVVSPIDFWPRLRGTTVAGAAVDPLLGGPPAPARPARAADLFPHFRWRIYFYNLLQRAIDKPSDPTLEPLVGEVATTLCRRWNAAHTGRDALAHVRIALVAEVFEATQPLPPTELFVLEQRCQRDARAP